MDRGIAATDETIDPFNASTPEEALPVLTARVDELARRGARAIVLPEKLVGVTPAYEDAALQILQEASRRNGVSVIAGLNRVGRELSRNTAFVFGPDGQLLVEYDKAFPVPALERGYARGASPGLFSISGLTAGVAICKDMDFPGWLRRYAAGDATIVFVPAWDFVGNARMHASMAILRGVEGGFAVVRSAQEGLLTISDHLGRVLAVRASSEGPEVLLSGAIARVRGQRSASTAAAGATRG